MKKILIIFFIAELVWKLVLKYLNYEGDSSPETRARILKFFTEADITIGQEYSRSGFFAGLGSFAVKNVLMFFLAFSPLSARLEDIAKKWSRDREWLTNTLFILTAYTVMTVLFLPLDFYFSYVLEHKFGFSNMTVGAWFFRELKNFLLGAVFMTIAVLPSLWIIRKVQFYWIFIVPTAGIVFGLFMSVLYPVLILPIYYDVEKIQEGSLKTKIMKLAESSKIPVSEIFMIKESEYSNHTNAFFVGFGDNKKIYLYDTLIKKNTEEETISVLAHEIGHWKYNHQIKGIVYEFIFSLIEFGILYFCLKKLKEQTELIREFHSVSALPMFILVFGLVSTVVSPLNSWISRSMEAEADYEALVLTDDPESFINSEIRLAKDNKSRLDSHPLPSFVYDSHPETIDRIEMAVKYREKKK